MAIQRQLRRGTAAENSAFTGAVGEVVYITDDNELAIHDGVTPGGRREYTDADALSLFNASGSAPVYACRAWVNFDGTGTVAIRASGNVSSITDNGVGDYTVNFATAMPDVNYASIAGVASLGDLAFSYREMARGASYFRFMLMYNTNPYDIDYLNMAFVS